MGPEAQTQVLSKGRPHYPQAGDSHFVCTHESIIGMPLNRHNLDQTFYRKWGRQIDRGSEAWLSPYKELVNRSERRGMVRRSRQLTEPSNMASRNAKKMMLASYG